MTNNVSRFQQLVRTAKQPTTVAAPFVSLVSRAVRGEFWADTTTVRSSPGPAVAMRATDDVQPPEDGAGALNRRRYQVTIGRPVLSAPELIGAFKTDPNRFGPTSFACFSPVPANGLDLADEVTVELPGPWDGPVTVTTISDHHIRFETRTNHMEAGWIEFRTIDADGQIIFEIESLARSGDPVFDALYHGTGVAKLIQTDMWVRVLEAAVDISGGTQIGRVFVNTTIFEGFDE